MSADLISFEWAIRALAQEAEVQKGLFPEAIPPAEELALEFERSYSPALATVGSWSEGARAVVRELALTLEGLSGREFEHLWLGDDALAQPEWSEIRRLARAAVSALGLSAESPGPVRAIYITKDRGEPGGRPNAAERAQKFGRQ